MLTTVIVILVTALFVLGIWLLSFIDMRRRRKKYIHGKFGKTQKAKDWNDTVRNYFDVSEKETGIVDDVTWNDLSLNEVFQRVNHCDTSAGEEILYWRLRKNHMSFEERQLFERRVRTFGGNEKEREAIENLLCDIGKDDSAYYIPTYMDAVEEYGFRFPWLYRLLQVFLAASFLFMLVTLNDQTGMVFLGMCVLNLAVYIYLKYRFELELSMVGTVVSLLENARQIAKRKEVELLFPDLKKELDNLKGVIRGERILRNQRAGAISGDAFGMLADYIMGVTLWQVTTYNKVIRRLAGNTESYMAVYRMIGELDAAISTASFRKSLPWYCAPEYTEEKTVSMEEIYHPLIPEPVPNSIKLKRSCLITGSNASGKSTFIKAVAVNAILAQALNTCAARSFRMPEAEVLTSMAVKDDLMAGESYFIREIRYLKRILDHLDDSRVMICAIDEILRGTNTGERIRASRAILEYLKDKNCIALVATHDKELIELLGDDYDNYHFSEEIGDHDITFSYKIMEGPATSQNAIKLLGFAGFPDEIIEAAEQPL